ncbi:MAG: DMT family transporter [Eubacteriales bacterium]|nr:DMT family transporter [Eubacteriales bacterium]
MQDAVKVSTRQKNKALAALVLVSIIWGSGFIATEEVIRAQWSTNLVMASRFSLAALLLGICIAGKLRQTRRVELRAGAISGFLLYAAFYCQTSGQAQTTVSNSALLTALNVLIVPFLARLCLRRSLQLAVLSFSGLAFIGMLFLSYREGRFEFNRGDLLVMLCAFLFAAHITSLDAFST